MFSPKSLSHLIALPLNRMLMLGEEEGNFKDDWQ